MRLTIALVACLLLACSSVARAGWGFSYHYAPPPPPPCYHYCPAPYYPPPVVHLHHGGHGHYGHGHYGHGHHGTTGTTDTTAIARGSASPLDSKAS